MKYILLFILALLILLIWLAFKKPMELHFTLDADDLSASLIMNWLTILHVRAEFLEGRMQLRVFLHNWLIFSGQPQEDKEMHRELLSALSLSETSVKTSYGLNEPHLAGFLFCAMNLICTLTGVFALEQSPDFVPLQEFFRVEGSTKLNVGRTAANLMKLRLEQRREKRQWISQT